MMNQNYDYWSILAYATFVSILAYATYWFQRRIKVSSGTVKIYVVIFCFCFILFPPYLTNYAYKFFPSFPPKTN